MRCRENPERQLAGMAVDQSEFGLEDLHALLRIAEPAAGDARADAREDRRRTLLRPDEAEACQHRETDTHFQRHREAGCRRAHQQNTQTEAANAICARNSAVTSTTVEAVGGVPLDSVQRHRAGAEHEAADLRERQAVGRGVAHHAAPDQHPGSAARSRAG